MFDRSQLQNIIAKCLENAPLGLIFWEADDDGIRVIDWNIASTVMFGWKRDEVIGRNFFDFLIPESDRPNLENVVRLLKDSSFPLENVNDNLTKDGRRITVSWYNTPVPVGGRFTVLSLANDITEDLAAKKELEDAYELTTILYQRNAALLSAVSSVLKNNSFKDTAREIFDECSRLVGSTSGYVALLNEDGTENEVIFLESGGRDCKVDPSIPMPVRGLRDVAYRTNSPAYDNDFMNSEWLKFLPEGHAALDNVLFAPLVVDGSSFGLIGLANKPGGFDAGDMEIVQGFAKFASVALANSRNLDKIAESESRLSQLLTFAGTAMYGVDTNGVCIFCNPACLSALGYEDETDLVGRNIHDLVHHTGPDGHEHPVEECEILKSVTNGKSSHGPETQFWKKDGEPITVEYWAQPIFSKGKVAGAVVSFNDITEKVLMQQNKRDLLSMLSHDLKNPVSVIMGNTDFMAGALERNTQKEVLDYIAVVRKNSQRMLDLIEELSFSIKMDLQNNPVNLEIVDPVDVVIESTAGVEYKFMEREIKFKTEVEKGLPVIMGDRAYLVRALSNLIQNALNYSVPGDTVKLKVCMKGNGDGHLCFEVSDNGPGIPEGERTRVFEKYYRSPRTAYVRGSGLGLHLVSSVVNMHGGSVELESEEGKGSTFRMYFPAGDGKQA